MSNISSNQSSIGSLILSTTRLTAARTAATANAAPVFGKLSVPASGDLKGLYGQLAKSFLARRATTASDTPAKALAAAASAASTAKAATNSSSSSTNADGDSVSLTKATAFKRFTRGSATPAATEVTTTPEAGSDRVTLTDGYISLEDGLAKIGGADAPGRYTFTNNNSRIDFDVTQREDGTLRAVGSVVRDVNGGAAESFDTDIEDGAIIRFNGPVGTGSPEEASPSATAPEPAVAQPAPAAQATPGPSVTDAASLSSRLSTLGASNISTSNDNRVEFTLNGARGRVEFDESGRVATGQLGESSNERVEFTLDASGNLTINGANDKKDTAAVRENAIQVRTLFDKQTSSGNVSGSGKLAATDSKVVTSGNTLVDAKMLKLESELIRNGGTFSRATGSTTAYTFRTSDGATGTYSTAAAGSQRIDGTYVKGIQSSSFRINITGNGDTTVSTGGMGLIATLTGTVIRGLLGLN